MGIPHKSGQAEPVSLVRQPRAQTPSTIGLWADTPTMVTAKVLRRIWKGFTNMVA
jgi:hypothetical protein